MLDGRQPWNAGRKDEGNLPASVPRAPPAARFPSQRRDPTRHGRGCGADSPLPIHSRVRERDRGCTGIRRACLVFRLEYRAAPRSVAFSRPTSRESSSREMRECQGRPSVGLLGPEDPHAIGCEVEPRVRVFCRPSRAYRARLVEQEVARRERNMLEE